MGEPVALDSKSIQISTSIGVAYRSAAPRQESSVTEATDQIADTQIVDAQIDLLAEADAALYQAKAAGRNTYRLHSGTR